MFMRVPWAKVWEETIVAGVLTNSNRGFFPLPTLNLFATFRIVCTVFTSGSIQANLRFGFTPTEAALAQHGCNSLVHAVLNSSSLFSVVYDIAAVPPGVVGSPPGILPPLCAVNVTTIVGTNLRYQIFATCISPE